MNRMMRRMVCLTVVAVCMITGVDAVNAQVKPVGLQGRTVQLITAEQGDLLGGWFPGTANLLFASVPGYGVYQGLSWAEDGRWTFAGPPYDPPAQISAMGVQHWGYGPMDGLTLFVGIAPALEVDTPRILRREYHPLGEPTEGWQRADSGLGYGNELPLVTAFAAFHFTGHTPPQPVIAWTDSSVVRSGPGGVFWERDSVPLSTVHEMDVTPHWFGNDIWAAGALYTGVPSVSLHATAFRSRDKGESWEAFPFPDAHAYRAYAVAVASNHPDTAWVSVDGVVQRTTDGGKNWQTVLQPDTGRVIALAADPLDAGTVYAAADRGFRLYRSSDLGESWRRIMPSPAYDPGRILCMTVALMDTLPMSRLPRFGLFLGTTATGVWVYDMLFGPTDVAAPPRPAQPQLSVYPRPARDAVSVSLELPATQRLEVLVHDVLCRMVLRRDFGEVTPGTHTLSLVTASLQPGSYILTVPGSGSTLLHIRR